MNNKEVQLQPVLELEKEMLFRKEFGLQILGETSHVVTRRKQDLLEWLKNFFSYTFIKTSYADKIIIHEIYAEYEKIPKKKQDISKRLEKRKAKEDYLEDFIIKTFFKEKSAIEQHLTYNYIARSITNEEILNIFGPITLRTLARSYVKPVLKKIAEFIPPKDWVWFEKYEKIDEETRMAWIKTLREEEDKADEKMREMMRYINLCEDAWMDDISGFTQNKKVKKDNFYKKAIDRFKFEYGDFPVQSYRWVLKEEYRDRIK